MSDSPKYTHASLHPEILRRLLEQRQQHAEQERALRQAEAQRRQAARLAGARDEVARELAAARQELAALGEPDVGPFVPAGRAEALRQRLARAEAGAGQLADEGRARQAAQEARALRDELRQERAAAEAARRAAQLARDEAALAQLGDRLAALDAARGDKFDAEGRREAAALVGHARSRLGKRDPAAAAAAVAAARRCLEQHQARVAERFARWTEERDAAAGALAAAGDRLAGLRADPVAVRWAAAEVEALAGRQCGAEGLLAREDFAAARGEAAAVAAAADAVVARAGECQLKEDQRQYVVRGVVEVMRHMGLIVQAGYPQLEHPGVPASATIIQAQRLGGGAIAVSVPQEGEILYDVDGFPRRVEPVAGGGYARTCDEAEEQIERMHAAMREAFGIETDELSWEGKDPNRDRITFKMLPGSAGAARQKGG